MVIASTLHVDIVISAKLLYLHTHIYIQIYILLIFTGPSIQLEVTCRHPCRAAVGCVLMASSTYLEVITPGVTQTGYSMFVIFEPISKSTLFFKMVATFEHQTLRHAINVDHLSELLFSLLCITDLPTTPESCQPRLGGNERSQRTPSILKGQAGVLGSEEQVQALFFLGFDVQ